MTKHEILKRWITEHFYKTLAKQISPNLNDKLFRRLWIDADHDCLAVMHRELRDE